MNDEEKKCELFVGCTYSYEINADVFHFTDLEGNVRPFVLDDKNSQLVSLDAKYLHTTINTDLVNVYFDSYDPGNYSNCKQCNGLGTFKSSQPIDVLGTVMVSYRIAACPQCEGKGHVPNNQ